MRQVVYQGGGRREDDGVFAAAAQASRGSSKHATDIDRGKSERQYAYPLPSGNTESATAKCHNFLQERCRHVTIVTPLLLSQKTTAKTDRAVSVRSFTRMTFDDSIDYSVGPNLPAY